ncbi:hypothetical protein KP509_04G045600 [Ceratopteris richardii]|nr:hypothetical protein KP509_04G045600 [Ceratopteris richardii]
MSAKGGLGYGIAIALAILVLFSTLMLALYVCFRLRGRSFLQAGRRSVIVHSASGTDAADRASIDLVEWSVGGLDEATLQSYPMIMYSEKHPPLPSSEDLSCSICLGDYKDSEMLRLLPDCRHIFHAACIDAWLRLHATCPMCRNSAKPTPQGTPVSTPLSELIPLARNPLTIRYTIHHNI